MCCVFGCHRNFAALLKDVWSSFRGWAGCLEQHVLTLGWSSIHGLSVSLQPPALNPSVQMSQSCQPSQVAMERDQERKGALWSWCSFEWCVALHTLHGTWSNAVMLLIPWFSYLSSINELEEALWWKSMSLCLQSLNRKSFYIMSSKITFFFFFFVRPCCLPIEVY